MKYIKSALTAAAFLVLSMCATAPVTAQQTIVDNCFTLVEYFEVAEKAGATSPVRLTEAELQTLTTDYNNTPPLEKLFPDFDEIYHTEKGNIVVLLMFTDGCASDRLDVGKVYYDRLMGSL